MARVLLLDSGFLAAPEGSPEALIYGFGQGTACVVDKEIQSLFAAFRPKSYNANPSDFDRGSSLGGSAGEKSIELLGTLQNQRGKGSGLV